MPKKSRRDIARENGCKSKGPTSVGGKQRSSQNAIKHGLYSRRVVLDTESQETYDLLRHRFIELLQPINSLEHEIVLDIVNSRWRIRRMESYETSMLNINCIDVKDQVHKDYANASATDEHALGFHHHARRYGSLDTVRRFEIHYHRLFDKSLKRLRSLRSAPIELAPESLEHDIPLNEPPQPQICRNEPANEPPRKPPPPPASPNPSPHSLFVPVLTLILLFFLIPLFLRAATPGHATLGAFEPIVCSASSAPPRENSLQPCLASTRSEQTICENVIMRKLSEAEIAAALEPLPGWELREGKLHREYRFPDFVLAFGFMAASAVAIEAMNHHPEWFNVWNQVTIDLWTHDAGGITAKDVALAGKLEAIAKRLL